MASNYSQRVQRPLETTSFSKRVPHCSNCNVKEKILLQPNSEYLCSTNIVKIVIEVQIMSREKKTRHVKKLATKKSTAFIPS